MVFYYCFLREEKRETKRKKLICCSTDLWLLLICALPRGRTSNLGVLGQGSNQLSYQARQ